ncbi:hypothetical protein BJ165DRAFT_1447779 [Panaeolus papilionaceus]|nr:hypothetical protein BJ165DRAFT_1447779 [Panaeolus papilionaceus]
MSHLTEPGIDLCLFLPLSTGCVFPSTRQVMVGNGSGSVWSACPWTTAQVPVTRSAQNKNDNKTYIKTRHGKYKTASQSLLRHVTCLRRHTQNSQLHSPLQWDA